MTRRFLALGDSYTIGEGVSLEEGWPAQLARRLRSTGAALADPEIIATTGWTTDELAQAIEAATLRAPYDLVTLLIGVNDQYRGRGADEFERRFRPLLQRAVTLAGESAQRVVVISIPDWSVTPFAAEDARGRPAIAAEIDRFNLIVRNEAAGARAGFVDITPSTRAAAADRTLLAPDGLHPSATMHARWVEHVVPAARRALAST